MHLSTGREPEPSEPWSTTIGISRWTELGPAAGWFGGEYRGSVERRRGARVRPSFLGRGGRGAVHVEARWNQPAPGKVGDWWESQPFNLNLLDYQGNCTWCWKKSLSKQIRLIKEQPEVYDFPRRMEEKYGVYPDGRRRVFFRESRSTEQMFQIAAMSQSAPMFEDPDDNSGCSESCEAFV